MIRCAGKLSAVLQTSRDAAHIEYCCPRCKAVQYLNILLLTKYMKQVKATALLNASLAGHDLYTDAPAYNVDIASLWAAVAHEAANGAVLRDSSLKSLPADCSQAVADPTSRKSLFPEQQGTALQESPYKPVAGLPEASTAFSHRQVEMLGHNQMRSPQMWSGSWQLAQQKVATHGDGQQPWIPGLCKQRAGTTVLSATGQAPDSTAGQMGAGQLAKRLAPDSTAGLSATQQVPGSRAGQLAAGEVLGSNPTQLLQCAKQQHIAASQTQSVAALQRAADSVPSWAQTTLPDHSGSPHHHGFLASAVMLETLGRQKQKLGLSLHASYQSPPEETGATDPEQNETHRPELGQGRSTPQPGQGGFSPESPTSHKWVHHVKCCALHYVFALQLHVSIVHHCS